MKSNFIFTFILVIIFCTNDLKSFAQSANGVSASITFGTMTSTQQGRSRRGCSPSASICGSSGGKIAQLGTKAAAKDAFIFFIDSNKNLNLLIHSDSLPKDGDPNGQWMYDFLHSAYSIAPVYPDYQYPGPCFNWGATSALAASICTPLGVNIPTILQNTYCAMSQPLASDTNYFQISFLGLTSSNAASLTMGNTSSNCDSTDIGICSILSYGANSDNAYFELIDLGDGTGYVNILVNQDNVLAMQPSLAYTFENYDGEFPGGFAQANAIDFAAYPQFTFLKGWSISAGTVANVTGMSNKWNMLTLAVTGPVTKKQSTRAKMFAQKMKAKKPAKSKQHKSKPKN